MLRFVADEFAGLWQFLKRNRDEAVIVCLAMLFLTLDRYNPLWSDWANDLFYLLLLPLLTTSILLRRNPLSFGIGWGDVRTWAKDVALVSVPTVVVLFIASSSADLRAYYVVKNFDALTYTLSTLGVLLAQEFFFRGFLIFGLKDKLKEGAAFIQVIPFVLVHIGKPEIETLSTILTGVLFGYIAYRGRSFWPVYIIHILINLFFVLYVNLVLHPAVA